MNNIICSDCGFEFSGDKCPQCGYNVNVSNPDKNVIQNKALKESENKSSLRADCDDTNYKNKEDKLDLVSMILGIVSLCMQLSGYAYGFWCAIIGLILGIKSKEKTKKRKAGIILNSISLILKLIFLILLLIAFSTDSM